MGKQVQVLSGYYYVPLPPVGETYSSGDSVALTDAEYAALPGSVQRSLRVLGNVTDPTRGGGGGGGGGGLSAVEQVTAASTSLTYRDSNDKATQTLTTDLATNNGSRQVSFGQVAFTDSGAPLRAVQGFTTSTIDSGGDPSGTVGSAISTQTHSSEAQLCVGSVNGDADTALAAFLAMNGQQVYIQMTGGQQQNGYSFIDTPKFRVLDTGDVEVLDHTAGVILHSPDGTGYRITVANGGALSTTAV